MFLRNFKGKKFLSLILILTFLFTTVIAAPVLADSEGTDIKVHINDMVNSLEDVASVDVTLSAVGYHRTVNLSISGNFALGHIDDNLKGKDVTTLVIIHWKNGSSTEVSFHQSNASSMLNIQPDGPPINMPKGSLTITKALTGDPAPTSSEFTFTVTGPNNYSEIETINGAGTSTFNDLNPGEYTVTETDIPANFTINGNSSQTVSVVVDQTTTVTFTNNYDAPTTSPTKGSLTITKALTGDPAPTSSEFTFTVTGPNNYSEIKTINGAGTSTLNDLEPGEYTVTETSIPANFTNAGAASQTVTIVAGQTTTVTFTNDYDAPTTPPTTGSLTITKALTGDPAPDGSQFTFTVTGPENIIPRAMAIVAASSTQTVTITDAGSNTLSNLEPGQYTVTETSMPANFTNAGAASQTVTIVAGQAITVTFTNDYDAPTTPPTTGSLTITKALTGDPAPAGSQFTFTVMGPVAIIPSAMAIVAASSTQTVTITDAGSNTLSNLEPGQYTVKETNIPANFTNAGAASQTVTIVAGQNTTVTFTNDYDAPTTPPTTGSLTITKALTGDPAPAGSQFTFTVTGPVAIIPSAMAIAATSSTQTIAITNTGSNTLSNLEPGQYTVTETNIPANFTNAGAASQTVTIVAGQATTTTFINHYIAPTTNSGGGGSSTTYYNITINYLDLNSNAVLRTAYNTSMASGNKYDLTSQTGELIEGYTLFSITGDPTTGKINKDIVINAYYTMSDAEILVEEPIIPLGQVPTPTAETQDTIIILDEATPLGELPKTGTSPEASSSQTQIAYLIPNELELRLKEEDEEDA